jgi:hypothetical protein
VLHGNSTVLHGNTINIVFQKYKTPPC